MFFSRSLQNNNVKSLRSAYLRQRESRRQSFHVSIGKWRLPSHIQLKGARSRCEYAHWVLPICQLYVSNFYCFPSYVTRSRVRCCKSRHLQVVLVTYCGVWCEIITIQYEEKFCSGNFEWSSTHFWASSLNKTQSGDYILRPACDKK